MQQPLHENNSMLTVFVHEMHNKLAVIRSSAGLMELYAEKSDQQTKTLLREHINQIHQTLDELSHRVLEVSMFIKLHLTDDEKDSSTNLDKLLAKIRQWFLEEKNMDLSVSGHAGYAKISNEHAEIVYTSMTKLALYFCKEKAADLNVSTSENGNVLISFPETAAIKDDINKLRKFLSGDVSIELHSALMSVYLANKIVKAYHGSLQLIQPEPGLLGLMIAVPSLD